MISHEWSNGESHGCVENGFESQPQSFIVVIAVVVVEFSLSHIIDFWFLVLYARLNWAFLLGFPLSNSSPHAERKPGLPP